MSLTSAIYEHLITKRKYNRKVNENQILQEDLDRKTIQLRAERRIHEVQREIWEKALKKQEEELVELKKEKVRNVGTSKKQNKTRSKVF